MSYSRNKLPLSPAELAGGVSSPAQTTPPGKGTEPVCVGSGRLRFPARLGGLRRAAAPGGKGQGRPGRVAPQLVALQALTARCPQGGTSGRSCDRSAARGRRAAQTPPSSKTKRHLIFEVAPICAVLGRGVSHRNTADLRGHPLICLFSLKESRLSLSSSSSSSSRRGKLTPTAGALRFCSLPRGWQPSPRHRPCTSPGHAAPHACVPAAGSHPALRKAATKPPPPNPH